MRFRPKRLIVLGVTAFVAFAVLTLLQNQIMLHVTDLASNQQQPAQLSHEVREFLGEVRNKVPSDAEAVDDTSIKVWPKSHTKDDRILEQLRYKPVSQSVKKIYLPNGVPDELQRGSKLANDQCAVRDCEFTHDLKLAREADAIVWMNGMTRMPFTKPINQVWVMFYLESPAHTPQLVEYNGLINWTATYRKDSVLNAPYERFIHFDNFTQLPDKPLRNYALNKTKKVAWFVSNCNSVNGRLEYARELQLHIGVDIYGACGNLECQRGPDDLCFKMLNRDYKFYLSFENSNCIDYITEKFYWNGLFNDVIPIVMGARREDYAAVAPPQSYIHVDDFESPQALAEYLHKLDKDDDLYNSYFRWKNTGYFMNTKFWCRLCAMLHGSAVSPSFYYPDIENWWRNNTCVPWSQTSVGQRLWATWPQH